MLSKLCSLCRYRWAVILLVGILLSSYMKQDTPFANSLLPLVEVMGQVHHICKCLNLEEIDDGSFMEGLSQHIIVL